MRPDSINDRCVWVVTPRYLYVGGQHNAQDHRELAFMAQLTGVCNMTWECPNFFAEEPVEILRKHFFQIILY